MENLVVDNLFVAQAARRARALAKAETLACAFIVDAMRAVREGGEMPPPVYGTTRRRRRRDDRDDADEIDADEIADEVDEETSFGIVVRCVGDGRAYERFWEVLDAVARGLRRSAAAAETTSSTTLRELYYVVNS